MEQASFTFSEKPAATVHPVVESSAPKILSVGEVVRAARGLVEGAFSDVWVVGEVSGFRPSHSGHLYFDLKDVECVLPVVCFKHVAQGFPFKVENGLELICHGKLTIYEKTSKFQINIDNCEPKGVGALQLAFEQLKKRLEAEGLFDARHKKRLPFCPRRVGVVTSPTGAAIRDILNILHRRFPSVDVLLAPARVQGDGAAQEIALSIALLDGRCDVMIVGRGGGSMEDLWAFNEEIVARAIFAAKTAIVSAVGHEIDFTIADFVADLRAPTPSAAAELVVPSRDELASIVLGKTDQLKAALKRTWELKLRTFNDWRSRMRPPTARFPDMLQQIDHCRERLIFAMHAGVDRRGRELSQFAAELGHLSPLSILAKGYAVVSKSGTTHPVRRVSDLTSGDSVDIRLTDGTVGAVIR